MKTITVTLEVELTGDAPDGRKFAAWIEDTYSSRDRLSATRRAIVTDVTEDRNLVTR